MSEDNLKNGEQVLGESISLLKKIQNKFPGFKFIAYLIAFLSAGGGTVFVWVWDESQSHIIRVATPKIVHIADSISRVKINHVLDSVAREKSMYKSFGMELSDEILVPRDSIASVIGRWYKREENLYQIGLFGNYNTGKILYRHVNGEIYRAIFKADRDYYYYFNDQGEWKQVK